MADRRAEGAIDGFVLTRQWRDGRDGIELSYWLASDRGPLRVRQRRREAVMFVPREVEARGHLVFLDGADNIQFFTGIVSLGIPL